jgi:hypothetical protein|tara:strand:+ start:279 stop:578 length:300 start_codon:yes stop_codon:yes gene_type:complete
MIDLSYMIKDMNNMKVKQSVHYKGKVIELPFLIPTQWFSSEEITQANHFSGEQTTLPKFAGAVRNTILQAELMQDYDKVRKGLHWFQKHFAPQYMVLLD